MTRKQSAPTRNLCRKSFDKDVIYIIKRELSPFWNILAGDCKTYAESSELNRSLPDFHNKRIIKSDNALFIIQMILLTQSALCTKKISKCSFA